MLRGDKNETIVVSALSARANFGRLLRRVEDERRSLVIEKRGTPKAVLLSIRDYVRLAAPEPEVLRVIGEESQRKGTDKLTSRQIDEVIKAARQNRSEDDPAPACARYQHLCLGSPEIGRTPTYRLVARGHSSGQAICV
jgi:prevent-host-death family protein